MALGSADVLAGQATGNAGTGQSYGDANRQPGMGLGSAEGYGGPSYNWQQYAQGQQNRWQQNPHYGDYSQPSPYQRYLQQYTNNAAPDITNLSTQQALLMNRQQMTLAQQAMGAGALRQGFGYDMRGLGLDRQALGIDRRSARRGLRMTRQEEEIMRQQLANSQAQANAQAEGQTWDARSQATASGAMTAPGVRHDLGQIYGNLFLGRQANQLGFNRDLLGLHEQRAGYRDRIRNTRLEAQRLGLSEDRLRSGLRQGLRSMRLDTAMSVNDILSQLSSNNQQQAALARQILEQALRASRG